jgi:halocyanin-like protein
MRPSTLLDINRRTVLKSVGAFSAAGMTGLAGCGGNGDGNGNGNGDGNGNGPETIPGSDYPAVDEWMTETEAGGSDSRYDGDIVDLREESDVTIDVGAEGNGDGYAYGPSAVAISAGTEVLFDWTGEGGRHNVEAEPDDQIGESDYEFSSGDAVSGEDNEYTHTFDESGIALYHCEPHLSLGMKGSIVVE